MKWVATTLPMEIEMEHVKGHQDRTVPYEDLPRQAQVNTDMDALANEIHEDSNHPTPKIPVFQSCCVAVLINNSVITDKLGKRLRTHITSRPLIQYLLACNQWTQPVFESIDRITLEKYLTNVPDSKRTNLINLMHGWQHTSQRKSMICDSDTESNGLDGACPLGCGAVECNHYYLRCNKQPGCKQLPRELKTIVKYLCNSKTHPDIAAILQRSLMSGLSGDDPSLNWTTHDPLQELISEAFHEQTRIRWTQLFLGRLSLKWKMAQDKWYHELFAQGIELNKSNNSQVWAKNLCQRLMFFALTRWQLRNKAYHDHVNAHAYLRSREELTIATTEHCYRTNP